MARLRLDGMLGMLRAEVVAAACAVLRQALTVPITHDGSFNKTVP